MKEINFLFNIFDDLRNPLCVGTVILCGMLFIIVAIIVFSAWSLRAGMQPIVGYRDPFIPRSVPTINFRAHGIRNIEDFPVLGYPSDYGPRKFAFIYDICDSQFNNATRAGMHGAIVEWNGWKGTVVEADMPNDQNMPGMTTAFCYFNTVDLTAYGTTSVYVNNCPANFSYLPDTRVMTTSLQYTMNPGRNY